MKVRKVHLLVFILSFLFGSLSLFVERIFGIGIDFHPDSVHYLTESNSVVSALFREGNFFNFLNNGFYFFVWLLNSKFEFILPLNILIYSFTNVLIFQSLIRINTKFNIGILLIIFSPYRTHLAIHVLKDTLFIFFSVWFIKSLQERRSFLSLLFAFFSMIWIRIFGVFNLFFYSRIKKYFKLILIISIIYLFFGIGDLNIVLELIEARNLADMGGRAFDSIPNFNNYGVMGALLRSIIWPMLFLTGFFVLLSPSLLFLPISFELFFSNFFINWKYRNMLAFLLISGIIAVLVNTFTAYTRYAFPLYILSMINNPKEL